MAKKVRCFTYSLKNNGVQVENRNLKDTINALFNSEKYEDIKELSNGNLVKIYKGENDDNYLSLELIKNVEREINGIPENQEVKDNHLLFRIGIEKDIEGAMKRELSTWEGKEIIDKDEQNSYNLEICTYILVDIENGIILELFGQYAPSVKALSYILNISIEESKDPIVEGLSFEYKNIMTEELISALIEDGVRLGKIAYSYEQPNLDFLTKLGLTTEEINVIKELGVFEVEVTMKGKGKVPLTRISDKIKKSYFNDI